MDLMSPNCPVCNNLGWVKAARVEEFDGFDGRYCYVGRFAPIPCFGCGTKRLAVLT